jgi:hypothetical protein
MTSLRKALVFGFLVWLLPFLISFCLFRVRQSNRPLFESIMSVVVAMCTASFLNLYFRRVERRYGLEGALLGILWCGMCIVFDLPMFLAGPMMMAPGTYMSEIGSGYLMIPAVTVPIGLLLDRKTVRAA